jgi:hypothetical protein
MLMTVPSVKFKEMVEDTAFSPRNKRFKENDENKGKLFSG